MCIKQIFLRCGALIIPALLAGLSGPAQTVPNLGKDPVSQVVAAMTLREKAQLVTGISVFQPGGKRLVPGAAGMTRPFIRLGIPALILADGPAGVRISSHRPGHKDTYYCTAFPVASLLASTWNTGLLCRVGEAVGNEALEYGVDVILGPGMNIHRNPLCGRNFEYYSEDPLLTGKMAAAMVRGIQSQGVGASIKHFAANNTETDRTALNTMVTERALREIYLEGFRIAVEESNPLTVMSSYNLINGVYAPESPELLTHILRNEWDFKGLVVSDWYGGRDPVAMMRAGNDLLMPGTPMQCRSVYQGVKKGNLDAAILDRNVERILKVIRQTPRFKGYEYSNKPDLARHAGLARQAAGEGMVLLKNDNQTLPLPPGPLMIAVFGKGSYEINTGGAGSGDVNEAYSISLVEGLKEAGFSLNPDLLRIYSDYLKNNPDKQLRSQHIRRLARLPEKPVDKELLERVAASSDIAFITIGRTSGEYADRALEGDFYLTPVEIDLIQRVTEAFGKLGKKSVVILNTGGVVETASWKAWPDAIFLAWQAGQETGRAIADVVSGKVNPSGKLATTFPVRYEDVPSAPNFPGTLRNGGMRKRPPGILSFVFPRRSQITYEEGIYVGDRHYNTFRIPVSYEFGYGLSYTTFRYSEPVLGTTRLTDTLRISVEITNQGQKAGKEAVQLYISAPEGRLDKPLSELKAFAKTRLLQPGESEILIFKLTTRSLASFDPESSAWITEPGTYLVLIGASSLDIRQTAVFTLD